MNMSYCRFQNTLGDLTDCESALQELLKGSAEEELSRAELLAAQNLALKCQALLDLIADAAGTSEEMDEVTIFDTICAANDQTKEARLEKEREEEEDGSVEGADEEAGMVSVTDKYPGVEGADEE